ncbi:hypothetical protein J2741_002067 [Methanolinea mesophila]|uniref:hypothetical protein n=1 Tax=Methanolinea mesophila TaxID=547055 RepID=UPI001AE28FCD|nr:hypothetical protein [Methanolinea mesophila]MBP1929520.1 hypothetical protein [Methanolinea mesophila]
MVEPATIFQAPGPLENIIQYFLSLPELVLQGDILAILIFFILIYIAIWVIQKLTTVLVKVLKKIFLLIVVGLAFTQFLIVLLEKIRLEGWTSDTLVFGIVGFVIGISAFAIALYVALHSIRVFRRGGELPEETTADEGAGQPPAPGTAGAEEPVAGKEPPVPPPPVPPGPPREKTGMKESFGTRVKDELSLRALKNDKRIGAVVAYIIIAEFGVFSSKTTHAPNIETGLIFFGGFMLASLIFVRLTYRDYYRGLRHLGAAVLIGGMLSLILGYFWGGIPIDQLLSLNYFATDALVALITGIALSLFMGSIT